MAEEEHQETSPEDFDVTPNETIADAEWQATLDRLGLGEIDLNKITDADLLYLAQRWQFLQVVESSGSQSPLEEPELITAQSGWVIHNYGDAMSTSPGRLIFGGGYFRISTGDDDDDEGGGGVVNPRKGTLVKQGFDTAAEMVRLAQGWGWGGMLIVDGHPDMMRAAWIEAVRVGVRLDGYTPTMYDERIRRRAVSQTIDEMRAAIEALRG